MTPSVNTYVATTDGVLTVTVNDAGLTMSLVGDTVAADFTLQFSVGESKAMATQLGTAEAARSREELIQLQAQFETEMGQELLAFNSQSLVKDSATLEYKLATTRLAFDAYQKGLDGPP